MMERTARSNGATSGISATTNDNARAKMAADLQALISDAEDLLKSTASQSGDRFASAKRKFESTIQSAKSGLGTMEEQVMKNTRQVAETTGEYVQSHPWQSVGIGAAIGLLFGMLLGRR